jgi:hypothetical protein
MDALLTPDEVADLLKISVRTVYKNAERLGGCYPAGIKVLRFRKEGVYGIMARPDNGKVEVFLPKPGQDLRRGRIRNEGRSTVGQGGPQETHSGGGNGSAPRGDYQDPHGILALSRSLHANVQKKALPKGVQS